MNQQPADMLITHGLVITADAQHTVIEDGAVAVQGQHIAAVGPTDQITAAYSARETIDARDHIVMPGLINGHTHAGDSLFRSLVGDIALESWLETLWIAERQFINPANVRLGTDLAIAEMVRAGITCALDMFWYPEVIAQAAEAAGFRVMTGPTYLDIGAYDATQDRDAINRDFLARYQHHALVHPCVQPHGTYTVAPDQLLKTQALADEFRVPLHIHCSETRAEVITVVGRYGKTPPRHLHDLGMLRPNTILAHCVHLDEEEVAMIGEAGAAVAHCPVCNLKLGSGVAPVPPLIKAGAQVMLGTDGPVSSNDLDLWIAMRFAALVHRGLAGDPDVLPAPQVVHMATLHAARALGLGALTGSLEAGKRADLILIGQDKPHLVPRFDAYSYLVYAIGREDVRTVLIDGRVVMRDRALLLVDEARILADVRQLAPQIQAYLSAQMS